MGGHITDRTAVYGPVRTVVWEGSGRKARPYPDPRASSPKVSAARGNRPNYLIDPARVEHEKPARRPIERAPADELAHSPPQPTAPMKSSGVQPPSNPSATKSYVAEPVRPSSDSSSWCVPDRFGEQ